MGAHTAISSNESRKRPGDEPLGPSSKRQRSSLHPNGRGEEVCLLFLVLHFMVADIFFCVGLVVCITPKGSP